ncbi:long-chain-fatty-acid--CoA ligase [Gordonia humi]|uniref:Long-chain acyl-CoA synthetase n=1 Tax=Gordonia humi TaxID=686429 RepID=A0A840F6K3_9ACTN|nr:long-chain fatty acid--CoA ligase [Gordonia humi]MBB4138183.1 long-chain acyl-CoA synthetase [Gordonia humi]
MINLASLLEDSARNHPERDALVLESRHITYEQANAEANRVANLLKERGVARGDKVALCCPNIPEFAIIYYGALKTGAVVVPLNVMLKEDELAYHLRDSEACVFFCFEGTEELPTGREGWAAFERTSSTEHFFVVTAHPDSPTPLSDAESFASAIADQPGEFDSVATEPDDTAVILYTSGTTGRPKGAELTHANTMMNAIASNRLFGSSPATDVHVVALPLFHTFGATVQLHAGFSMAATLLLVRRFDPRDVIHLLEHEDVTFFAGVPTMWWGLLNALSEEVDVDRIARNLRIGVSGGASLPMAILEEVEQRLGVRILEGYGLSETSPVVTFSQPGQRNPPGSIGKPIWGVEVKLVDQAWRETSEKDAVGEIAVKGHNVMKGYHRRPEATAEVMRDGWFRTGDLARRDSDGYYYIVDRSKDLIIRGGYNVYPRELEEVIISHPEVSLVAVVGVPHESHGEEVKAFVVRQRDSTLTEQDLISWCKERIANYKYPRLVQFVDSLPMTATGKILKRELTAQAP